METYRVTTVVPGATIKLGDYIRGRGFAARIVIMEMLMSLSWSREAHPEDDNALPDRYIALPAHPPRAAAISAASIPLFRRLHGYTRTLCEEPIHCRVA